MSLDQLPYPVEQVAQLNTAVQQALASQMRQVVFNSIVVIPPGSAAGAAARSIWPVLRLAAQTGTGMDVAVDG